MSAPNTPSAASSGDASPAPPATTAAQAIALAATTDRVVDLTSPPATKPEENSPPQDDDPPPSQSDRLPANPDPTPPVQPRQDKPPPARPGQPRLQPLAPRASPAQAPSAQGQQPTGQPHAQPAQGQPHPAQPPLGQPPQGPPQPGQPHQGQPHSCQPYPYAVGPGGQPLYYYVPPQNQAPQYQPLGPMRPLPRGRPPRPKPPPPPPPQPQHPVPSWGTRPVVPEGVRKPPLGPAYTRGGHLLGGYNPARYMGVSHANPHFDADGKFFYLTSPNNIGSWIQEITCVARALSCFDEMTKRFVGFPPPNTVQLFICETRFATAWRILEGTIPGQVWAYMRVLGYSSIPANPENPLMSPTPADCFEFAQRAASRMLVPGTPEQPQEERKRMVEEILMAQSTEYPSERSYKKGIKWLRLACDSLIKQGDYALAVSLYDPVPDWAPKPADWEDPAPEETGADGAGAAASPEDNEEQQPVLPSVSASASPVEQAVEAPPPPASTNGGTPSPAVPAPTSQQAKPKKRKRPQKDDGAKAAQAKKTQPESTAGP